MNSILVYRVSDGDILRCVICPVGMEDHQCNDGEAWIAHDRVDDATNKIDLNTMQVVPV